jgi:hypothetical protein
MTWKTEMWLLILEAGFALFLLVFIVWWTMFSGKKPEPPAQQPSQDPSTQQRSALPSEDESKP